MRKGITVLIPVYNGARYLAECVRSVREQSLPAAEIVVIDDGSEDATPEVCARLAGVVRYQRFPHGGLPYARNHGVRLAETEFLAFVDSDDLWLPQKLEWQMAALARETAPTMIFGYVKQFISDDLSAAEAAAIKCNDAPLPGWFGSTLLMRKSDCERAGTFDETIEMGEFIEWFSRAKDADIKPVMIPNVVCRRRLHRSNMSRSATAKHTQYARTLKMILDRRRD